MGEPRQITTTVIGVVPRKNVGRAEAHEFEQRASPVASVANVAGPITLVYNRLSKTGGTVLQRVLPLAVQELSIVNEATSLKPDLARLEGLGKRVFVIGSIRDPCSMLL